MSLSVLLQKPRVLAFILFIVALSIRTFWLDKFPVGIVHDNMIFVLNAKAVYYTGRDVSGLWHPLKFSPIPDEPAQAEVPYTLMAPIIGPFSSSLFAAHIFHAIVNSFFVVILFGITLKLLGKWPAFIVGLVATFNPWAIFFGRSAFEASLALFFYTLGLYVLIITSGWKKLWAVIPLSFGFYTFMAYKLTFLPYVFIISYFIWKFVDRTKNTKQYLILIGICIVIFSIFIVNVKKQTTAERLGELSFFFQPNVEQQVNFERRWAIQNPITNVVSNKASVSLKTIITKYLKAFSPEYFFIKNENTLRYSIFDHGFFYYVDAIFLLLGFCYLFTKKRELWLFLVLVIAIAPLPSVISNVDWSYATRSSLYYPFFYILIGSGIWYMISLIKTKKLFFSFVTLTLVVYGILISNFLYIYFFIQPVYSSEGAAFSARLVADYAALAHKENKFLIVVARSPKMLFKNFMFYSNSYNAKTTEHFKEAFLSRNYSFEKIAFKTCEEILELDEMTTYIFDPGEKCPLFKNVQMTMNIPQLSDSGTVYAIYQDSICGKYNLKRYVSNLRVEDFLVENLSTQDFCETFIIDFNR